MKNNQKGFSTLLGLLLFIVLAGGGLYLYTEKNSKEIVVPETKEETSTTTSEQSKSIPNENKQIAKENVKEENNLNTIEDGGHWVYVKNFFENKGKYYLSFDKYDVGECPEDGNLHPAPCLFNDNPLIRTIEINSDARLNLHKSIDGVREWRIFNPVEFMSYLKSNSDYVSKENINDGNYVDSLYGKIYGNSVNIDTENNKIISVEVAFPS